MYRTHVKPVGVVDTKGNYTIINQDSLRQQKENIVNKKARIWQELYGNDKSDRFVKTSDFKKVLCANEIIIQEQENKINSLEKRIAVLSSNIKKQNRETNKRFNELINALTKTFAEVGTSRNVNVFVAQKKK